MGVIPDEWHRLEDEGIWVPVRAVPKERPQIGKGKAYFSKRYTDFREAVAQDLARRPQIPHALEVPLSLEASFDSDGFWLQLRPVVSWSGGSDIGRPTHVRGDVDNLVGGVADALQDAGVISDDKWIWEVHARVWEDTEDGE